MTRSDHIPPLDASVSQLLFYWGTFPASDDEKYLQIIPQSTGTENRSKENGMK